MMRSGQSLCGAQGGSSARDIDAQFQEATGVLQKRFLASADMREKVRLVNELASMYGVERKRSLVSLCLCESLRLNPAQDQLVPAFKDSLGWNCQAVWELGPERCLASVIIPTYERPQELKESIRSVLNQTIPDLEVIVVNDGGGSETEEVVAGFGSEKIRYIRLPRNRGLPAARNEGLRQAAGRYIAYLDDDDVFYENHLEVMIDYLESHPDVELAYANAWWAYGDIIDGLFIPRDKKTHPRRPKKAFDKGSFFERNYISTLNVVHRREALKETGLFNEDLPKLEDWDLLLRFALRSPLVQINEITGEYRWKHNNLSLGGHMEMEFWTSMLRGLYGSFRGNMTLALCCRATGSSSEVRHYLERIEEDYERYPKNPELLKQLADLVTDYGEPAFRRQVFRDYFDASPRRCLKQVAETGSVPMALAVLPALPGRAMRSVAERCLRRLGL